MTGHDHDELVLAVSLTMIAGGRFDHRGSFDPS
jgi:hypothetical protein